MSQRLAIRLAALMGLLAVALGAFGAHGFKEILLRHETVAIWDKAVLYHFIHALMLYVLAQRQPVKSFPWLCFFIGILIFSGSLYLLALTGLKWLGAITPLGGVSFIAGWVCLMLNAGRDDK